jgi:hypothetical protein
MLWVTPPAIPITLLIPETCTQEAIGDWHYWVAQGCIL